MLLSLLSKRTLYDDRRDSYRFTVRPQHAHRYREYANIYKEDRQNGRDFLCRKKSMQGLVMLRKTTLDLWFLRLQSSHVISVKQLLRKGMVHPKKLLPFLKSLLLKMQNQIVEGSEDDSKRTDSADAPTVKTSSREKLSPESCFPGKEELASLVRLGVPKDLRGEVWQAFVGVRTRRVDRYYQDLLAVECDASSDGKEHYKSASEGKKFNLPEKLKMQIGKDLP
ncbi:TBC1 domain family member 8B-like [Salvia divinorum]|uniref:TBC1 domain family member 8B-like n=1 Tax=Salvia divinorum TaxID=28513 RepID=A0ABD1GAT8_SALDI